MYLKKKWFLYLFLFLCITSIGCEKNMNGKKGILVVSFGTSYAETRKLTIEACENKIAENFSDYVVMRAFTSKMIIKILRERDNILVDTPEEALLKMYNDGFSEIIVQPLHIMPGQEYHEKIIKQVSKFHNSFEKIVVGRPLLFYTEDYRKTIEGIRTQLPELGENEAVVFMGHGSHHPANASYSCLQSMINDEEMPIYIGTVESYPDLDIIVDRLERDGVKKITLMPFMLVAGDHAINDMASDEEGSWKTVLAGKGFDVSVYLHGLGENAAFQDIYVQHVSDAISEAAGE